MFSLYVRDSYANQYFKRLQFTTSIDMVVKHLLTLIIFSKHCLEQFWLKVNINKHIHLHIMLEIIYKNLRELLLAHEYGHTAGWFGQNKDKICIKTRSERTCSVLLWHHSGADVSTQLYDHTRKQPIERNLMHYN